MRHHQGKQAVHNPGTFLGRQCLPGVEGFGSSLNGCAGFGVTKVGYGTDNSACSRVGNLDMVLLGGSYPAAIDVAMLAKQLFVGELHVTGFSVMGSGCKY